MGATQFEDGRVKADATLDARCAEFGAEGLRRIAAELLAAADEVDRLTGRPVHHEGRRHRTVLVCYEGFDSSYERGEPVDFP